MSNSMPIELYTDGSCLRNPGSAGLGYVIRYWKDNEEGVPSPVVYDGNQGFRLSTNSRMEIMAGIYGINKVFSLIDSNEISDVKQINLFSDSKYFCDAINQNWIGKWMANNWMTSGYQGRTPQPVKNKDLWEQVIDLQNKMKERNIIFSISHVDGHSGVEFNERADKLAVAASSGTDQIVDEVYEKTTTVKNWR